MKTTQLTCGIRSGILLISGLLNGCGTLSNVKSSDEIDQLTQRNCISNQQKLAEWLPKMVQPYSPGMAVGVITSSGERQYWSYGVTDDKHRYPVNENTLFAVGSLSKGMTAEATAVLVEQGKLHWSDTLKTLLPQEVKLSPDAQNITLLQLVTHTSGLPRQKIDLPMLIAFFRYLATGENFYTHLDSDEVLNDIATFRKPNHLQPQYSNLGYAILDYVLHYQSGQRADELVNNLIFLPLGIQHSSFMPQQLKAYPWRAIGHAGNQPKLIPRGQVVPDWKFTRNMMGAGSLYSTAADLLTFAAAHLKQTGNNQLNRAINQVLRIYYPRQKEAANIA